VVRLNDMFGPGDRDYIMQQLRTDAVGCNNYFPPIHLQPYVREMLHTKPGDYPVCEFVAERTIALPFYSQMTGQQVERVCATLEGILDKSLLSRTGTRI
jgi:perosamine synthetase